MVNFQLTNENERTLYLGDLDIDTSEKELFEYFYSRGVQLAKIVKQPHSSFAHVTFMSTDTAKHFLNNSIIELKKNRIIRVMPFNQPNNFDPEANLIIKNLESHLNESHIIQKFKNFGAILSCKLVRDERGESKCYAYLQFKDKTSAEKAIENLNNTYWDYRCDPDYKYKLYTQKLSALNNSNILGKYNESNILEQELFDDFNSKMGKKIYVGVFKKKEEYTKIKQEKDGKPSNLYVKNFGTEFGDRDLFILFKKYGSIKSAKVRRSKIGLVEKPLGCGFVDFESPEEAEKARQALDGFKLSSGKILSVTYADCKSRRMRKKMEEGSETKTDQDNNFKRLSTASESFETTQEELNEVFLTAEEETKRRDSLCSDYSADSSIRSVTCSVNDLATDLWSKVLRTNNWNEYRLFDNNFSLFRN